MNNTDDSKEETDNEMHLLDLGLLVEPGVLGYLFGRLLLRGLNRGLFSDCQLDWVPTIDKSVTLEDLCTFCLEVSWGMGVVILKRQ